MKKILFILFVFFLVKAFGQNNLNRKKELADSLKMLQIGYERYLNGNYGNKLLTAVEKKLITDSIIKMEKRIMEFQAYVTQELERLNKTEQDSIVIIGVWVQCPNGFSSKKIEFKANGTYRQFMSGCTGSGKYKGIYRVEGNILIMQFSVGEKNRKFLIKNNKLYHYNSQKNNYSDVSDLEKTDSLSYKNAFNYCKGLVGY